MSCADRLYVWGTFLAEESAEECSAAGEEEATNTNYSVRLAGEYRRSFLLLIDVVKVELLAEPMVQPTPFASGIASPERMWHST